ncbi:MAG: UDP-N-acetylmuramate dehydrogenase [Pleurocapsa minor GSE-CHR-MK-17-07R]|jgi:UDP-N-acetylmuramate dehydrogenase|nr:UDP-N-acetylmuramate dehydrogenase [Pleurocapsa minor GSE-CHR-MK 17-07R]
MTRRFPDDFLDVLLRDETLARYSALRLGGPADWLFVAQADTAPETVSELLEAAWASGMPVRVLGGGSNTLISDTGARGLVVVNRMNALAYDEQGAMAASGAALTVLARKFATKGLAGFEWAASVPGTLGGAVVNNAGAHGGDMAGNVRQVEVLFADAGLRLLALEDLAYDYRLSSLKARADKRFLVLRAWLALTPDDPATIQARMEAFVSQRKRTQPQGASLGSIFKNPPGDYAGRLIESCGLKGFTIGGAQVSPVHANFFINSARASAADYRALIQHVQAAVHAQTGVLLHPEVEFFGDWQP